MRTDPSDTGGLFVGRRPGTAPVRYRETPLRGGRGRRTVDAILAGLVAFVEGVIALLFWGPIPVAWLWIGSQAAHAADDALFLGILIAFFGTLGTLMIGLVLMKRVDAVWIIIRRAAGHEQKKGIIGPVFGVTSVVGATAFTIWLIFIGGLGASLAPQ